MSTLQDKQAVQTAWRQLLQEWEELDEDDPPCWRKSCNMLTFFITQTDEGLFEFAAHGGDDVVIIEGQKLDAVELEEAMDESDDLIAEFVEIGASILRTDEIRIKQAFVFTERVGDDPFRSLPFNSIMAVGEDGRLYYFNGQEWEPRTMKLKSSAE